MKIIFSSIAIIAVLFASIFVGGGHVQHLASIFGTKQPTTDLRASMFYDPDSLSYKPATIQESTGPTGPCVCPSCCSLAPTS